jgi:FtsP/CotA-like multicopper oxidase with cupredoxin domain
METNRRRLLAGLAAGGVLAAALTGGGVAIATTGSSPPAAATVLTAAGTPGSAAAVTVPNGQHAGARGAAFRRFARRHPHVVRSAFRSAAAYLGLAPAQLRAQLRDGKSLAQVAAAKGKPVQGLENAILAGAVKAIDAHTGWSAARKAAVTARVKNQLNAVVNATFPYGVGRHGAAK